MNDAQLGGAREGGGDGRSDVRIDTSSENRVKRGASRGGVAATSHGLQDGDDVVGCFAAAEDHFRESSALGTRLIDAGERSRSGGGGEDRIWGR